MLQEKTQAEMVTLTEIKKNLQGINSAMDEGEDQINDLKHNEEENIQLEQQEEKNPKKMRIGYGASGTTLSVPTFAS